MDIPGGLECVAIISLALHPVGDLQSTGVVLHFGYVSIGYDDLLK